MALNVNREVQDAFYRYKMPRLLAKVEGKGNGVKTVLPNMVDVAKSLGRPPTYTTKYFGCELGAQTRFDFKNDRYIVNGVHDADKLQDILDGFIRKFVLCEKCDNPETVLKVSTKKSIITASCKACGHSYTLDMRHKLTTFILKNPPDQDLKSQGTSLTEKKAKRSRRKDKGKNDEDDDDWGGEDGNNDEDNDKDNDKDDDDDAGWTIDVSETAVKSRMLELTSGVKGLAMDDDMEKSESERINIFHKFVKSKMDDLVAKGQKKFEQSVEKEILAEAERLEVANKATIVLCELLLDESNVCAQIADQKRTFLRFTNGNQKAQKYLMGGFEKIIESKKEALLPKTALILKAFYDQDILDEEVILDWGKKVSKKYVSKELAESIHKKAEPFLTWLKEAEEEDEDSDEGNDDDDIKLDFDERAKHASLKEKVVEEKNATNGKQNGSTTTAAATTTASGGNNDDDDDDEEDDIDIDDI